MGGSDENFGKIQVGAALNGIGWLVSSKNFKLPVSEHISSRARPNEFCTGSGTGTGTTSEIQ